MPSSRSHPFGDLAADAPHLAALVAHLGDLQPTAKVKSFATMMAGITAALGGGDK